MRYGGLFIGVAISIGLSACVSTRSYRKDTQRLREEIARDNNEMAMYINKHEADIKALDDRIDIIKKSQYGLELTLVDELNDIKSKLQRLASKPTGKPSITYYRATDGKTFKYDGGK